MNTGKENLGRYSLLSMEALGVHTVNHKKRDILFLTITLVSLDRFS